MAKKYIFLKAKFPGQNNRCIELDVPTEDFDVTSALFDMKHEYFETEQGKQVCKRSDGFGFENLLLNNTQEAKNARKRYGFRNVKVMEIDQTFEAGKILWNYEDCLFFDKYIKGKPQAMDVLNLAMDLAEWYGNENSHGRLPSLSREQFFLWAQEYTDRLFPEDLETFLNKKKEEVLTVIS